jgi:hypothetical protein
MRLPARLRRAPAETEDPRPGSPVRRLPDAGRRWLVVLGVALPLVVQLGLLLLQSRQQYDRYNLSLDFGIFHQAWHQIAQGDLDPRISPFGYSYVRSHLELIMWLLAPLEWLYPHGIVLLWLQDLATVGAEAVAIWWTADLLERKWPDSGLPGGVLLMALAGLAAVNPWIYVAAAQDFHLEAIGVLFAILAARDFWAGRHRRAALWTILTLMTGDVSGTYVAGIGASVVLAKRRQWRLGLALMAGGAGWVALAAALHANLGSGVDSYAYLIGKNASHRSPGALAIVAGIASHPSKTVSVLWNRRRLIVRQIVPTGTLGIAAPWVAGPLALVLLENGLNKNPFFIQPSYQNLPVYVFGLVGTGVAIEWLARRSPWRGATAMVLTGALAAAALHLAWTHDVVLRPYHVDAATAADLAAVKRLVPGDAEVIASFGIAGRFADRRYLYLHSAEEQVVPVHGTVAFVFAPGAGNQYLPHDHIIAVASALRDRLRIHTLENGPRVFAYLWVPDPGTDQVQLSAAPGAK